jgi:hypothetical protein
MHEFFLALDQMWSQKLKSWPTLKMTRFVNSSARITKPRRSSKRTSTSTRVNPQVYSLPYAHRANITFRAVPSAVRSIAGNRVKNLIQKRKSLNSRLVMTAARTRRQVLSNNNSLENLRKERAKVNREIMRLRALSAHAHLIPSRMAPELLRGN